MSVLPIKTHEQQKDYIQKRKGNLLSKNNTKVSVINYKRNTENESLYLINNVMIAHSEKQLR